MNMKLFKDTFTRMYRNSTYRIWLWVLGFFTVLFTFLTYKSKKGKDAFAGIKAKSGDDFTYQIIEKNGFTILFLALTDPYTFSFIA